MTARRLHTTLGVAFAALGLLVWACTSPAVDVAACKRVEDARCQRAPECGISLALPPHPDNDVTACIRFYDVACEHGLATPVVPNSAEVTACVNAILSANCTLDASIVQVPQDSPACAWLIPPGTPTEDAGEDAGGDADSGASDAATDALTDADDDAG